MTDAVRRLADEARALLSESEREMLASLLRRRKRDVPQQYAVIREMRCTWYSELKDRPASRAFWQEGSRYLNGQYRILKHGEERTIPPEIYGTKNGDFWRLLQHGPLPSAERLRQIFTNRVTRRL